MALGVARAAMQGAGQSVAAVLLAQAVVLAQRVAVAARRWLRARGVGFGG